MTYKAVGRSIINYAAPVWSTNLRDTNYRSIQYTQNEALRIATGCHKMSSVDHLHAEAKMLKVREHSELLSAQYLARCLEPGNVCHSITSKHQVLTHRPDKWTYYNLGDVTEKQLSECSNTAVAMNFLNTLKQKTSTDGESMKQIESSDERHVFNLQKFDTTSVSSELKNLPT